MNDATVASRHSRLGSDRGFTMIEVLAAIVILGIVTTAATLFSIQALQATETQQRRQVAVAIATEAMEAVNSRVATVEAGTGVSYLLGGRNQTLVTNAWTANSAVVGVAQTYAAWDPGAASTASPRIPLTGTETRNGTIYSVTTLIGWCYQSELTSDCIKVAGSATPPASPSSSLANRMLRVITVVRWSAGEQCSVTPCDVQIVTLVDGSGDLEWKTS